MMNGKNHNSNGEPSPRAEAVKEAAVLLRGMRFSRDRGPFARGDHVIVVIDPLPNKVENTSSVLLKCYAWRTYGVQWEGMPIFIHDAGDNSAMPHHVAVLDEHGRAFLPKVPAGDYTISAGVTWGASGSPVPRNIPKPWSRLYKSNDERVAVIVRRRDDGLHEVHAGSKDVDLAGASVLYAFVEPETQELRQSGRMKLEIKQKTGISAIWQETPGAMAADAQEESQLVFCVV